MNLLKKSSEEIKGSFKDGNITVSVFGLGKMGLPLVAVFADKGADVIGVDIDEEVVEKVNDGINHVGEEPGLDELVKENVKSGNLKATTDSTDAAEKADICIILVPTLTDEKGNIQLDPVLNVTEKISEGLEEGNVVITEATMPPGTTEKLISILEESGLELGEFGLGHAPERTMTGTAIRDITGEYPKIIGADDENTLKVLDVVYSIINDKGTIKMENIISAESVKVFEGVYRDVNIALANELAKYCEEKGINALDVFEAANSQPYCDIHEPGAGVAGHCIPVYPWFVINQTKKRNNELLRTAREINDSMPYHMIDLTIKGLNEVERSVKNSNILILGLTFRGGVKEFMKTPAEPIIKELKELGANVFAYDPICEPEDAERYGAEWKEGYEDVDAIMIITDHEQFKELDFEKIGGEVRNKVLIDGRNVVKPEEMKKLGFEYKRVGL